MAISLLQSRLVDVLEYHLLQNDYTPAQLVQAGNVTTTLGVLTGTPATLTFSQPEPNVSGGGSNQAARTASSRPGLSSPSLASAAARVCVLLIVQPQCGMLAATLHCHPAALQLPMVHSCVSAPMLSLHALWLHAILQHGSTNACQRRRQWCGRWYVCHAHTLQPSHPASEGIQTLIASSPSPSAGIHSQRAAEQVPSHHQWANTGVPGSRLHRQPGLGAHLRHPELHSSLQPG